jgi:hypothetical protein
MKCLFLANSEVDASHLEYDFLTAAAYVGKLSIARELSAREENLYLYGCNLGQPSAVAAISENIAMIDLLMQQAKLLGQGPGVMWYVQFQTASRVGSVKVVEHLLASEHNPGFAHTRDSDRFDKFQKAVSTPNVELFEMLLRHKETTLVNSLKEFTKRSAWLGVRLAPLFEAQLAPLTEAELALLLYKAAENGWENMVDHLLKLGAPTCGNAYAHGRLDEMPLFWTCKTGLFGCGSKGCEGVARLLLQHGATITGVEMEVAAKRGSIETVRILLEHGADSNIGEVPPIVSAVKLEHKRMFHLLLEYGAELGEAGLMAVKEARKAGLDSMLTLLEQHGVNIEEGLVAGE